VRALFVVEAPVKGKLHLRIGKVMRYLDMLETPTM